MAQTKIRRGQLDAPIAGSAIMTTTTGSVVKHDVSGITAGSYSAVIVDNYGHVTDGSTTSTASFDGTLTSDLVFNNFNLQLTIEPSTDEKASGLFWKDATVDTNAQGIGAPLFMAADGHFDAATGSMITAPCVALALESGSGIRDVLMLGVMRQDTWNWTTGPGRLSLIYISGSLGTLTQTIPTLEDQIIQPVGWAISDDCIWFNPSMMFATHTG